MDENLAGISERQKLRLRWYGDTGYVKEGNWEIKCKERNLGWKVTRPMRQCIPLLEMNWQEVLVVLRANTSDYVGIHLAQFRWPTLINSYQRLYYLSWDMSIRITVDYHQSFFDQRLSGAPNLTRRLPYPDQDNIVLEVKAPAASHDQLAAIVQHFPVLVTRNSKYVNGMLHAIAH